MQADNRAIHAAGAMPLNVITANTLQTPDGILNSDLVTASQIGQQMQALLSAYPVAAIKIGMLGSASQVEVVQHTLKEYPIPFVVLDPVVYASSGQQLLDNSGIEAINTTLLENVDLLTPNRDEEAYFDLTIVAAVLHKGGHDQGPTACDILRWREGPEVTFSEERIISPNLRGTGCALSSAIAAYRAHGYTLKAACQQAKILLHRSILTNRERHFIGKGPSFLAGDSE